MFLWAISSALPLETEIHLFLVCLILFTIPKKPPKKTCNVLVFNRAHIKDLDPIMLETTQTRIKKFLD